MIIIVFKTKHSKRPSKAYRKFYLLLICIIGKRRGDWKKFEQNNKKIALNILFVPYTTEEIRITYKSKYNHERKNRVILLMSTNGEKWHYLAVKSLPALLRGLTSNHNRGFYCSNYFHSYSTKNRLRIDERVCNDHDYCYVEMPNEDNKILEYNYGEKSLKAPFFISFDIESLLQKSLSEKKLNIRLPVTQCLHVVHLMH